MRILELFAGIGGVAAAVEAEKNLDAEIVQAIDIDTVAKVVYQENFSWPYRIAEIASVTSDELASLDANLWWLSPPCLPFSVRGMRKDLHDPRNQALMHLIGVISQIRPPVVIIENVPGFETSQSCKHLVEQLCKSNYHHQILDVCPTAFGWCNKRRRIYFVAWQPSCCDSENIVSELTWETTEQPSLSEMVDHRINRESNPELYLDDDAVEKYLPALDRLTVQDIAEGSKPTACYAASYGKTYLHAGSYLVNEEGVRRFSPDEVKRQLGFDKSFNFPSSVSTRPAWKLLGSSLSIPVVRALLSSIGNSIDLR